MTPPILSLIGGNGRWGQKISETLEYLGVPHIIGGRKDWRELVSQETCEGVIIATPTESHIEIAELALKNDLPVFIEKPLSLASNDLLRLFAFQDQAILVNHLHLFSWAFQEIMQRTRTKDILEVKSLGFNFGPFRPDCGGLFDYGCHDLSMSLYLAKEFPEVERAERLLTTVGEIYDVTLKYKFFRHHLMVGNGATHKRRYFEVQCVDGFHAIYDDLSSDKLVINGKPIIPVDAYLPLTNSLRTFIQAIQLKIKDDRLGLKLPRQVLVLLETIKKKAKDQ